MDAVSHLRASLLPILQGWEQELRREYPDVTTEIYDGPVGGLTDWRGHDIGIECTFKNVALGWPDNLALSVSLKHLHKTPSIQSADVGWGHPGGYVEASVLPDSVEFSPDRLVELIKRLPELFAALKQAVRRGRPRMMWTHAINIKTIERTDGKARVYVLRRNDGLYEYRGEAEIVGDEYEGIYWAPTEFSGLYASAEEATGAAFDDVPWLRQNARQKDLGIT